MIEGMEIEIGHKKKENVEKTILIKKDWLPLYKKLMDASKEVSKATVLHRHAKSEFWLKVETELDLFHKDMKLDKKNMEIQILKD